MTWLEFKREQKALIWPNGVPENLVGAVDKAFINAMIDLQRWIPCLQVEQTTVYPQDATHFHCGTTVIRPSPKGRIRRIYAVENSGYCNPVPYSPTSIAQLRCWSRGFMELVASPLNAGLPVLPLGYRYPDATTDSEWGRALTGLWAVERGDLHVAPWLQSTEALVVEWDGLKRSYADGDIVSIEEDVARAIRLYLQMEYGRDWDCDPVLKREFQRDYQDARADLIWECEQERKQKQAEAACDGEADILYRNHYATEDEQDTTVEPPTEATETLFAVIGGYGLDGEPADDVADLVKGWDPQFIVTTGGNNFSGTHSTATYDAAIGKRWRKYIYPFEGDAELGDGEEDAEENRFWPVLGAEDLDVDEGEVYKEYFSGLPGNKRYYDFVRGHVHFFMLNSGLNSDDEAIEADGSGAASHQATIIRGRIAQSTARWKVAVINLPPWSSNTNHTPGYTEFQWLNGIGLDAVLSGTGNYERLLIDELPVIAIGSSGGALQGFGAVATGSVLRDSTSYGAVKGTADCDTLKFEFISRTGTVIDTLALSY